MVMYAHAPTCMYAALINMHIYAIEAKHLNRFVSCNRPSGSNWEKTTL